MAPIAHTPILLHFAIFNHPEVRGESKELHLYQCTFIIKQTPCRAASSVAGITPWGLKHAPAYA